MATNNHIPQGLQTTAIHAGEKPDMATRASSPSIVMSSSFIANADTPFSAGNRSEGVRTCIRKLEQSLLL